MKICIDPGHNGVSEPGAVGPTGLKEADCTLAIAMIAADELRKAGVSVLLTRVGDKNISLTERCRVANEALVDGFVSIHINSAANNLATGTETYSYATGTEGEKLAKSVQTRLVEAINLPDRGAKTADFQVLRGTLAPAVLTEVCFICNPAEESLLRQECFLQKAAQGIVKGVLQYFAIDAPIVYKLGTFQDIIQARCRFDDPAAVWKVIDNHPYAGDVYQKWADSYEHERN